MPTAVHLTQIPSKATGGGVLERLDKLYAYYHRQMWYRKQMYFILKQRNAVLNGLALVLMAMGMVLDAIYKKSIAMMVLVACSALLKGWMDFKRLHSKMDMCRFAYTTFEKIGLELLTFARGLTLEDDALSNFLITSHANEEAISDLAPPIPDRLIKQYDDKFQHIALNTEES